MIRQTIHNEAALSSQENHRLGKHRAPYDPPKIILIVYRVTVILFPTLPEGTVTGSFSRKRRGRTNRRQAAANWTPPITAYLIAGSEQRA